MKQMWPEAMEMFFINTTTGDEPASTSQSHKVGFQYNHVARTAKDAGGRLE